MNSAVALDTMSIYGSLGLAADNIVDMNIGKVGHKRELFGTAARLRGAVDLILLVDIFATKQDGSIADVVHGDIGAIDTFGLAATEDSALETKSDIGTAERAVADDNILHTARDIATDDKAAVCVVDNIVFDKDILARAISKTFLTHTALHADAIVTDIDSGVDNKASLAVAEIEAVAILCIPRASDSNTVDDDVAAADRMEVEARRVLNDDTLEEDVRTFGKTNKVGTNSLLLFRVRSHVGDMMKIVGKPQLTAVGLGATHGLVVLPFDIADLATLDRAPVLTVAVDNALASNGDIGTLGGRDKRRHFGRAFANIERTFWREDDKCPLSQMEVDIVLELDRSGKPDTGRDIEMATTLLAEESHSLLESVGVKSHAIALSAKVEKTDTQVGEHRKADLRHFDRQIAVTGRIVLRRKRESRERAKCN